MLAPRYPKDEFTQCIYVTHVTKYGVRTFYYSLADMPVKVIILRKPHRTADVFFTAINDWLSNIH